MKTWLTMVSLCCWLATGAAQSRQDEMTSPAEKQQESEKIPLQGYDKNMSFSIYPYPGRQNYEPAPADSSATKAPWSIHSEEWKPERSSQQSTPCSKARPALNL